MRRLPATLTAVLSGLVIASVPAAPTALAAAQPGEPPVVHTEQGAVRGVQAEGVDSFLGIRYAAAPVGNLRWAPPEPVAPWEGVLPAEQYGNRCPATESTNGPRSETEDCLFVNVQRPAGGTPEDRKPVYVFIHGGGLVNGSSNQADMAEIVSLTGWSE